MIYGDNNTGIPSMQIIMQSSNLYVYCGNDAINFIDPTGNYNRDAAVAYALKWSNSWYNNPDAVRFTSDCTNFVSFCLQAGGLKQSDDWYFHGTIQVGPYIKGSYSRTWTLANDQFNMFTNANGQFPNKNYMWDKSTTVCIHESRWIASAITTYNIQPGDLLYWADPKTGTVEHAAIIVSVNNGRIKYAQHNKDKNNGDLGTYLDRTPDDGVNYTYVYVVRIRNEA